MLKKTGIARIALHLDAQHILVLLYFFGLIVSCYSVLSSWTEAKNVVLKNVVEDLNTELRMGSEKLSVFMSGIYQSQDIILTMPGLLEFNRFQCPFGFSGLARNSSSYAYVVTLNGDGDLICRSGRLEFVDHVKAALRPFVNQIRKANEPFVTNYQDPYSWRAPIVNFSMPVETGQGEFAGAIVLGVKAELMNQSFTHATAQNITTVVFDQAGLIVASSRPELTGSRAEPQWIASAREPVSSQNFDITENSQNFLISKNFPALSVTMVVFADVQPVVEEIRKKRILALLPSLAILVIVGLLGLMLNAFIFEPLSSLAYTVDRQMLLPPRGMRDLRRLGRSVNRAILSARGLADFRQKQLNEELTNKRTLGLLSYPFLFWNKDGRLSDFNEAARDIFPRIREKIAPGLSYEEFLRFLIATGSIPDAIDRERDYIHGRLESRRRHANYVMNFPAPDIGWVQLRESRSEDGSILSIYRNINTERATLSDLRVAEAQMATIVSSMAEGLIVQRMDGMVIRVNEASCRLLDVGFEGLVGRNLTEYEGRILGADGIALKSETFPSEKARLGGGETTGQIVGLQSPKGHITWVSLNARLAYGKDMDPEMIISTMRDITAERVAIESSSAKSRQLKQISHDMRGPLHSQLIAIRAIRRRSKDGGISEQIDHIASTQKSMTNMVNSLLEYSRLEAGDFVPSLRSIEVMGVLQEVAREHYVMAAMRHVEMRVVSTSLWVMADTDHLTSVLRNLISNAIRHTNTKSIIQDGRPKTVKMGRILIGARNRGQRIEIVVIDNGTGIDPIDIDRIFEEFERGKGASNHGDGLGLGLSFVKRLTLGMRGLVSVKSTPGKGSAFSISLPKALPGVVEPVTARPEPVSSVHRARRIALLDDDALIRQTTKIALEQMGHQCRAFGHAEALLEDPTHYDGYILDQKIGDGWDGLKVAEVIRSRRRRPESRIVIVTGETDDEELNRIRRAGVPVLLKPVSVEMILSEL